VLSCERDLVFSETLLAVYTRKNLYGSQPEGGFTKIAETSRCNDISITFQLCLHNKVCVGLYNYIHCVGLYSYIHSVGLYNYIHSVGLYNYVHSVGLYGYIHSVRLYNYIHFTYYPFHSTFVAKFTLILSAQ